MRTKKNQMTEITQVNFDRSQIILNNDDFYIREAYKALRTNVMFSLTDSKQSHVILVTSANPSEGKSTTSANLAISFAELGIRTLLIDCDMRKPKIGRLFKMKNVAGLSDVLFNKQDDTTSFFRVNNSELYIMTAGTIPPNPSELLASNRMKYLIESLREKFEYIILDMPPVNVVTDAVVASSLADGILLVVRSNVSERSSVLRTMAQLERTNTKILGAVMTMVEETNSNGYSRKYEYGYGYEPTTAKEGKRL